MVWLSKGSQNKSEGQPGASDAGADNGSKFINPTCCVRKSMQNQVKTKMVARRRCRSVPGGRCEAKRSKCMWNWCLILGQVSYRTQKQNNSKWLQKSMQTKYRTMLPQHLKNYEQMGQNSNTFLTLSWLGRFAKIVILL